jgi:AsmA protein
MPMKQLKLPLAGRLQADLAKQTADLALTTRFDESNIALRVDVDKFSPLVLGFDVDIDQLNVDKYLPPKKAGAEAKAADGKLDFSALDGLNLHGSVKVGSLQVANVKASNVRLQIKAAGGRLEIAPHSARLYDGTLNGSLALDANGNRLTLKENLAGVNINPLMQDLADKDLIEGRGNVALDVTARGDSVAAMKKALAGTASVALKDGALKGINLAQSFRELKSKFSGKEDAVQQAKQTDKTDFSELTASFRIANGVAHNDDLAMKSPFLRLAGSGDIDVGNGRLDYLAKASVVATAGGQGAKDLEHLKGLTVPVRASGPFDKLAYKIEFGQLATEAVKARVEEKTQEIKQKATDKLLKGIFGR